MKIGFVGFTTCHMERSTVNEMLSHTTSTTKNGQPSSSSDVLHGAQSIFKALTKTTLHSEALFDRFLRRTLKTKRCVRRSSHTHNTFLDYE